MITKATFRSLTNTSLLQYFKCRHTKLHKFTSCKNVIFLTFPRNFSVDISVTAWNSAVLHVAVRRARLSRTQLVTYVMCPAHN